MAVRRQKNHMHERLAGWFHELKNFRPDEMKRGKAHVTFWDLPAV